MKNKLNRIKNNPKVQQSIQNMKPERSIWGFLGVVVFFILPEIVAFIYGEQITSYAQHKLSTSSGVMSIYYDGLIMLFEDGGSWFGIIFGLLLLVWLFKSSD